MDRRLTRSDIEAYEREILSYPTDVFRLPLFDLIREIRYLSAENADLLFQVASLKEQTKGQNN